MANKVKQRAKSVMRQSSFYNANNNNNGPCSMCQKLNEENNKLQLRQIFSLDNNGHYRTDLVINPVNVYVEKGNSRGGHNRRARSEVRAARKNSMAVGREWLLPPGCYSPNTIPDLNGNNRVNKMYAEPVNVASSRASRRDNLHRKISRSKSKSRMISMNSGLLTIWPGKAGVWLPQ